LELLIAIALGATLLTSAWVNIKTAITGTHLKYHQHEAGHLLAESRALALATDTRVSFVIENNHKLLPSTTHIRPLQLPTSITASLSQTSMGFTHAGNASPASTLTLSTQSQTKKVTNPIGYGQITVQK
jgi:Tfp pilus assembly protein FimT